MESLTPEQLQALVDGPALTPPAGIKPNFIDPPNLTQLDFAIVIVTLVVTTLCMVLRFYTKIRLIRSLGWEDWTALLAWGLLMCYGGFTLMVVQHGLGRHQWDVQLKEMEPILWGANVASVLYGTTTAAVKCSILLQYLSIFHVPGRRDFMWWSCWTLIWLLVAFYFISLWTTIFTCHPREKAWTPWLQEGACMDLLAAYVVSATVNMVADAIIIALPQRSIWMLSMPKERKIKVSAIFFISLFVLASSIMRLYYAVKSATSPDTTYYVDIMCLWSYAEFMTTILCSCLPSLARLFGQMKLTSSTIDSKTRSQTTKATAKKDSQTNMSHIQRPNHENSLARRSSYVNITDVRISPDDTQEGV